MIRTLLVANRGEIAARVVRTCREMGIRPVVAYSDADADSPAVRAADRAVRLGPAPPAQSYLDGEWLLALARGNGAEAIHPGYGFLSENAAFARACAERGVTFVGPPAEAIAAMGDKARAKRLMADAGVPVLPGYSGGARRPAALRREAARCGYPLMVKAVAGGGGRGIRIVHREAELDEALEAAGREAAGAFGDGRLMLERWLPAPRHVEVQVLADAHGNAVHLCERECSVQRRHQKLVEEAPSPALDDGLREAMGAAAVRAAQAVGYVGAGTVEFLLDESGAFHFLEMNTRLQVEHPVTEAILGLDLVRLQIEVAEGRPLPFAQADLRPRGHAVECRLIAEDPARDFLPAVGRLGAFDFPQGPGFRVDAGYAPGGEVPPHYDSLLAKLIAWGPSRSEALRRARALLGGSFVTGLPTNLGLLQRVLEHPDFAAGRYTTRLLEDHREALLTPPALPEPTAEWLLAAAAVDAHLAEARRAAADSAPPSPWSRPGAWRSSPAASAALRRVYGWPAAGREAREEVEVRPEPDGHLSVRAGGLTHRVRLEVEGDGRGRLDLGVVRLPLRWSAEGEARWLSLRGTLARLTSRDAHLGAEEEGGMEARQELMAPLPGTVIRVAARAEQAVAPGDLLVVVEAMKVEHRITAPFAGIVKRVRFAEGDPVDKDALLVDLEPVPDKAG